MKNINLTNVKEQTTGPREDVKPGGYICRIVNVTDVPEKEYLRIDMDIASGDYKGFYQDLANAFGFWGCTQYWSYKDSNLGYFKGNIKAVEESNSDYRFSSNEQDLRGRLVGAVFGEEEYMTRAGDLRCSVKPRFVCSAQRILDNDYKVPKRKVYQNKKSGSNSFLDPVVKDVGAVADELDAWAKGQKLPWED